MISEQMPISKRRKLTMQDAEAIATMICRQKSTETDACIALDINVNQWFSWKNKQNRQDKFTRLITRIKECKIAGYLDRIESAGQDKEILTAKGTITKSGDWRALAWLADKEPRFAPQTQSAPAQITVNIGIMHDTLKRVIGFNSDANDSDNRATIGFKQSLLSDSVTVADDITKRPISHPTKIKLPVRKIQ